MNSIEEHYCAATEKSAQLNKRAERVMPGGDTRTTTYHRPYPLTLKRGEGPFIWDVDGNKYIDLIGNYTTLVHGNAYPPIAEAVTKAVRDGSSWPARSEAQIELATLLCERVASVDRVRFCNSGTEAGMLAAHVAPRLTGRKLILMARYGYHGSYDDLARIQGPVQDYLTDPARMKRFYSAVRGRITSPGPARPVFRANTDMMLFTTRMRMDANGKPHIPGSLEVWRNLFLNHPQGKYDGKLTKLATNWKEPDDVLEALFALSRKAVENEPLKIFMAIGDIDRNRATPLSAPTVDRLARDYHSYGSQYPLFSESRSLSEKSIILFLDQISAIAKVKDPPLHSDTAGTFQAVVGLWQILVRQQSIPDAQADSVFSGIVGGFAAVKGNRELFDAGRAGVKLLLGVTAPISDPHGKMLDLLAGNPADSENHDQMVQDLMRILEAQRIVSLDTLFQLADHIESVAKGEKLDPKLVNKLASRISEIQLPRAALSATEKNSMGFGYWTDRHLDAERKLNLRAAIEKAAGDPEKVKETRALLAPLLRDTLLAFNYAHYAPPGAQILYTNPVFVRSHDFFGMQGNDHTWRPTELFGTVSPSNGGDRLVGSLSSLPYALAEAEQNFLIPTQTQALIWGDLVPQMILSAKIPRFWQVTPGQLHWVGLHLRYGRELLAEAALDSDLRTQVLAALGLLAAPVRTRQVAQLLEQGVVRDAVDRVTPSNSSA